MESTAKIFRVLLILLLFLGRGWAQENPQLQQLYRLAIDYERMGLYDRAAEQYQILFQQQPVNTTYYRGLIRNLERLGRNDEVVQVIRQRLAIVDDALGRSDLGSALYRLGEREKALEVWEAALQRFPTHTGVYAQVAAAMLANGLFDQAIAVYRRGRTVLKNASLFTIEIANALAQKGQFAEATEEFLKYLEDNPRQFPYIERRILTFFDQEESQKLLAVIEARLKGQKNPPAELLKVYASCLKRVNRWSQALQVYLKLEDEKKDRRNLGGDLYNFANEASRAGERSVALNAYNLVIQKWPDSPFVYSAHMGLAEVYLDSGDHEKALAALDAIAFSPGPRVFRFRALQMKGKILLNELHRPAEAIAVYETLYADYPGDPRARREAAMALGDCYVAVGRYDKAEEWYATALSLLNADEATVRNTLSFKLAMLAFYEGRFQESIRLFEKLQPSDSGPAGDDDLVNDALEWTFFIEQALPDSATALRDYAVARQLWAQNRLDSAAVVLESLVARYPASVVAPRALMDLGELFAKQKRYAEQIAAYRRVLETYPASIYVDAALLMLARAQEAAGDIAGAMQTYEKLLADYPSSIYLEEARQRLRALRQKAPQSF